MEEGLDDVHDSPVLNALIASQIIEDASNDATLDLNSTTDAASVSLDNNGGASVPSKALKRNAANINSSDDFKPTAAVALKWRRLIFQGSKSAKISASMPTGRKAPHTKATPQN